MRDRLLRISRVLGCSLLVAAPLTAGGAEGFAHFESLVGEWEGTAADGQRVRLTYESVAAGTAIFEKLVTGEGEQAHDMATVYHVDGDRLMLTHYCATGNQPRMAAQAAEDGEIRFELIDVTNLASPGAGHMQSATFSFADADHFETAWTWNEGGEDQFTVAMNATRRTLMSDAEREDLLTHLDRTRDLFLASIEGLSPAQLAYRSAEDRWSIADCAEHIAASEGFIRGAVENMLSGAAMTEAASLATRKDETVTKLIVDRSQKFQAPEGLRPTSRFGSFVKAREAFEASRVETIALAGSARDLRAYQATHPAFSDLDAYGWLLFLSGHTERHTLQIEEVKADPGFPGS